MHTGATKMRESSQDAALLEVQITLSVGASRQGTQSRACQTRKILQLIGSSAIQERKKSWREKVEKNIQQHWSLFSLFSDQVFTPSRCCCPWSLETLGAGNTALSCITPRLSPSLPFIISLSLWCHWHYKPPRPDGNVHVLSAFHSRIYRRKAMVDVWTVDGIWAWSVSV